MTGAEFSKPMIALASAFKGKFALNLNDSETVKDTVMDNWYEFFKDYRAKAFEEVCQRWIEKEDKAPLIKDLKARIEIVDERIKKEEEKNEPKEISLPTEWDFRQSSDSKIMTYAEWIYKYFGVRIEDEVHTV